MLEPAVHFLKVQTFRHIGCDIKQIFTSTFLLCVAACLYYLLY